MNIAGKRVLISGGSSGIGFALAEALLVKGAKVATSLAGVGPMPLRPPYTASSGTASRSTASSPMSPRLTVAPRRSNRRSPPSVASTSSSTMPEASGPAAWRAPPRPNSEP
jgi:hypothetical protein